LLCSIERLLVDFSRAQRIGTLRSREQDASRCFPLAQEQRDSRYRLTSGEGAERREGRGGPKAPRPTNERTIAVNEEILKRLDSIGAKLASLGTKGFDVMVRQAQADAIANIVWAVLWAGIAIVCASHVKAAAAKQEEASGWHDRENATVRKWLLVVGTGVSALFATDCITSAAQRFYNPHFYAIEKLIGMVK
jgi:hypothetical protein